MMPLRPFFALIKTAPRSWVLGVIALMVLVSLTEGIGILLLIPLLELLSGAQVQSAWARDLSAQFSSGSWLLSPASLLGVFVALVAFRSAVQYAREQLSSALQHRLVDDLRQQCFDALMSVEWRWLVNSRKADHASLLLSELTRVGTGLNFSMSLLAGLVTLLAYLITAFLLSWTMTSLALLSGVLVFALLYGQRRRALNLGYSMGRATRALFGNVQETLAGIKLSKILGTERRHVDHFMSVTTQLRTQQVAFAKSNAVSRALLQTGGAALLALYLFVGLSYLKTPIPILLTLVYIFSRLIPAATGSQQQFHHWLHTLPAFADTQQLLSECRAHAEPKVDLKPMDWPPNEGIALNDVCVAYAERDQFSLAHVSLHFPAKATSVIMGASGAGKSTLADVLMGLLVPNQGQLLVGDRLIEGELRMAWRRQVAYVPQEVFLFHDTIRRNLLWGQAEASDEELQLSLQRAAADFVFKLPQGLDTVVGDSGIRLSGGERQRLGLARALLKKPQLLILDEATSALDRVNEARIYQAIEQLHGDITVVIIGHRLSNLRHADQVIVLEQGWVVGQGPWAEIEKDARFAPYFHAQVTATAHSSTTEA
jgi:ATP-binding cassette, subfamily C, bacterial